MKPWWHFTTFDVIWCVCWLTVLYWVFGPPSGWWWLAVAPSLLAGHWIAYGVLGKGRRR